MVGQGAEEGHGRGAEAAESLHRDGDQTEALGGAQASVLRLLLRVALRRCGARRPAAVCPRTGENQIQTEFKPSRIASLHVPSDPGRGKPIQRLPFLLHVCSPTDICLYLLGV